MNARHYHLTPEEDSVGDADESAEEIDDLLPADLWFQTRIANPARTKDSRAERQQ